MKVRDTRDGELYLVVGMLERPPLRGVIGVYMTDSGPEWDDEYRTWDYAAAECEVVDDRVPSSWTERIRSDGIRFVQPAAWQHEAFWNRMWGDAHPNDAELDAFLAGRHAGEVFLEEIRRIRRELG